MSTMEHKVELGFPGMHGRNSAILVSIGKVIDVRRRTFFILVLVVLNLHLLRNVSAFLYLAILALLLVLGLYGSLPRCSTLGGNPVAAWFLLFLATSVWPTAATFIDYGLAGGVYAAGSTT